MMKIFKQTRASKTIALVFLVAAFSLAVVQTSFGAVNGGSNPFSNGRTRATVANMGVYPSELPGQSGDYGNNQVASTGVVSTTPVGVSYTITCDAQGNVPADKVKEYISKGYIQVSVSGGNATIVNKTNCKLPVSLASYKMFDSQLGTQVLSDYTSTSFVAAGTSQVMFVRLPSCMAQVDLYYGDAVKQLDNANSAQGKTLAWDFYQNSGVGRENPVGPLCGNTSVTPRITTTTVTPCVPTNTVMTAEELYRAIGNGRQIDFGSVVVDTSANKATVTIKNYTDKIAEISLSSYQVFDSFLSHQQFYNGTGIVSVPGCGEKTLTVQLPNCFAQIDLWSGLHPRTLLDTNPYVYPNVPFVINFGYSRANNFCGNTPGLSVEKTGPGTLSRGDTYSYDLKVKNTGNVNLQNVVVTDMVPNQTTYARADISTCSLVNNSTLVNCDLGEIAVGQFKTIKLYFKVSPSAVCESNIYNTAKAKATNISEVSSNQVITRVVCDNPCVYNCNPQTRVTLQKQVRNVTRSTGFADYVTASSGDTLEYRIVATNEGNTEVTNLNFTDVFNNSSLVNNFRNLYVSTSYSGNLNSGSQLFVARLLPGQSHAITYNYTVVSTAPTTFNFCNSITLNGSTFSTLQDTACVQGNTQGSNVFLNLSKRAFNDTQNRDAVLTPAKSEDYITYFLRVSNTGNSDATSFVVQDDLSGVLPLADMVDLKGGSLNGQVISYPAVTVPAGGFIEKSFRVRVKAFLPNYSFVMRNVYGNQIDIPINPKPPVTPPKTGGMTSAVTASGFGGIFAAGFALLQRRRKVRV